MSYVCGATLPTQDGVTPLHNAAGMGHVVVARLLLDWGADRDAKGKVGVCRSGPCVVCGRGPNGTLVPVRVCMHTGEEARARLCSLLVLLRPDVCALTASGADSPPRTLTR